MTTPEAQPAPAVQPAQIIDLCDRSLGMVGLATYSELVAQNEALKRTASLRFGQVYRLTRDLLNVALGLRRNTEADLEEAVEVASSAAKRGGAYLHEADTRPDLRVLPDNVVLLAAHRVEIVGGRL